MEILKTYDEYEVDLKANLNRIGDIINIDGPVLSLFQDKRNEEFYLFDWVDSDEKTNRWLIYKINPEILFDFLIIKISYRHVFNSALLGEFYFADIENSERVNYSFQKLKILPEKYLPAKDVFLDSEDTQNLDEMYGIVRNVLSNRKKSNIINKISFTYNFIISQDIFAPPLGEALVYIDTTNELTQLEEQNYVGTSNRVSKPKGMGLLY